MRKARRELLRCESEILFAFAIKSFDRRPIKGPSLSKHLKRLLHIMYYTPVGTRLLFPPNLLHDEGMPIDRASLESLRNHKTLRVTPAMEAGIAHHVWDLPELLA